MSRSRYQIRQMSTYFDHALNFFDSSLKKVEEIQQAAFQTEKLSKEETWAPDDFPSCVKEKLLSFKFRSAITNFESKLKEQSGFQRIHINKQKNQILGLSSKWILMIFDLQNIQDPP